MDYTRHLEEISKKTEVIVLETIQNELIKGDLDKVIAILGMWEKFSKLLRSGSESQTMTEETKLFITKLKHLEEIWTDLKLNVGGDLHERLVQLQGSGSLLISNVSNEKSLNVGGKFEWVDSILIKCMQEGSWLLIDNVNLCSPAVLDRLNALLEPNGVLTIGERGMKENGEMFEIKPHKDFRLFLTMDPKNGEISRAMRNRGIEIFLLNEYDEFTRDHDLDLKSLVNGCGLTNSSHIEALVKIHYFVTDLILGEKPNINHLLQAAFLTAEQLLRGVNLSSAISHAVTDVYYKSRTNSEFTVHDALDLIENKIILVINDQPEYYNNSMTLQTRNLVVNSSLERIKQQTVFLQCESEIDAILYNFLINAFTIGNSSDLTLRCSYIKSLGLNDIQELCDRFFRAASNYSSSNELPFDNHWLPDHKLMNVSNNLYVLLYYESRIFVPTTANKEICKQFSLLDFLNAVRLKRTESKLDEILEMELLNLLDSFDQLLMNCLRSINTQISDEVLVNVLSALQWRFVLSSVMKTDLTKMGLSNYRKLLDTIQIYYKWFVKYCYQKLVKLINVDDNNSVAQIIFKINSKSSYDFSVLHKLAKSYQKIICKPPPPNTDQQILLYEEYRNILDCFDLYNSKNDLAKVMTFTLNHHELRPLLISARHNVQNSLVDSELRKLYEHFGKNTDNYPCYKTESVELLPIFDHFARLSVMALKNDSASNQELAIQTLTIPPSLIGIFNTYSKTNDKYLQYEMRASIYFYLLNASSLFPFKFNIEEGVENIAFPQYAPTLSFLLVNLLTPDIIHKELIRTTTYGNYKEITKQHRMINLTLWKNMLQISHSNYDFLKCESRYLQDSFMEFYTDFSRCLNVENSPEACIEGVRQMYDKSQLQDNNGDCEILIGLLRQCSVEVTNLIDIEGKCFMSHLNTLANVYFLVNYLKTLFNSKLSVIDPLRKVQLKHEYCREETKEYSNIIRCYELQNNVYSGATETIHKHTILLKEKIAQLEVRCHELSKYSAVRSQDPNYGVVSKEILHYFGMVLTPQQITKLYDNLNKYTTQLQEVIDSKQVINTSEFEKCVRETKQLCTTYSSLITVLHKYRFSFADIIMPLLNNVTEFVYALTLKTNINTSLLTTYKNMTHKIDLYQDFLKILRFPAITKDQTDYIDSIRLYTQPQTQEFIKATLTSDSISKRENFRLLKCGIQELYNIGLLDASYYKILDSKLFTALEGLIKIFVKSWKQQQEELERKRKEEESLYKITSKTEEEEIEEQFKNLFPSFHDQDFSDFQLTMLDDEPEVENIKINNYAGIITLEDVKFVSEIHSHLLYLHTRTEWLYPDVKSVKLDFVTPLLSKCKLYKIMFTKFSECFNYKMDAKLLGTLNIVTAAAQNLGDTELITERTSCRRYYDFYKDPNVKEVRQSFTDLKDIYEHSGKLLEKWPDHPTLKSIQLLIERIHNFDITSPLSRFLTGFEVLLLKCHEWEENAHSGVSLQEQIQNLVKHIIAWRKIEMNVWKESLNIAFERMNEPIAKWWFYIYELVIQFIEDETIDMGELLSSLKQFIVQSNLAEFSNRLQLFLSFHYYVVHMKKTAKSNALISIFWNLYNYYKQFEGNVTSKILELRSPIEKKLKEYIKIVKWKDISYWAIKQTIERTHKTIHKHIREFETVLKQPATTCLTCNTSENKVNQEGIWDKKESTIHKSSGTYLSKYSHVEEMKVSAALLIDQNELFMKARTFFKNSRILCKKIISTKNYPVLIQDLDNFVTDVISTSVHLQNLEIDTTLPKDKQKSQAKGILQQKRKGLADLFKALTEIGLSYKSGIVQSRSRDECREFLIQPIDLSTNSQNIDYFSDENDYLFSIWEDCEKYYYKSLSKLDTLRVHLKTPAKDLGLSNVERCLGFSEILTHTIYEHKSALVKTSRKIYYLQYYYTVLVDYIQNSSVKHIPISLHEKVVKLVKNIIIILEQYKIILHSCPDYGDDDNYLSEVIVLNPVDNFICYKNDELWQTCMQQIDSSLTISHKLLKVLSDVLYYLPSTDFKYASKSCVVLNYETFSDLDSISISLKKVSDIFIGVPLMDPIEWIQSEIVVVKTLVSDYSQQINLVNLTKFKRFVLILLRKMLLAIQTIYKNSHQEVVEDDLKLKRDHLKTLILQNLSKDVMLLNMQTILQHLHRVIVEVNKMPPIPECKLLLSQITPILQQLLLLYQYFFTQQVSVYRMSCKMNLILCNIFTELATKGFCVPPEFSDELNSEGDTQQASGGLGLGEGEGERDVSDRIESEDQLEDAQPAGKEKEKDEDKDCKEEEKGIEMSEDFDAKMQDVDKDKDEDNEDNKQDSDDDAEEQMGETEKDAEQLDQEIWGSDNEENDEEDDSKEEKGDRGEKQGEDELGAKESECPEVDDQNKKGNKPEDKEQEINEMKEPEIDDNQIDPYHGNPPQYPEPEAMDLPEDIEVDDDMQEKGENPDEENPFDIDKMKEQAPSPEPQAQSEPEIPEDNNKADEDSNHEDQNKSGEDNNADVENDTPDDDVKNEDVKAPQETSDKDENKENPQSILDETQTKDSQSQAMDVDDIAVSDNVKTNPSENQESSQPNEDINQEDNPDKEGVGQSRMEQSKSGHKGQALAQENISSNRQEDQLEAKRKPGETDSKRSLGDVNEPLKKKLKTIDSKETEEGGDEDEDQQEQVAEMYKHIQNATKNDSQVLDSATKEQAEEQKETLRFQEDENSETGLLEEQEDDIDIEDVTTQKPEKIESDRKKEGNKKQHPDGELLDEAKDIQIEGEQVPTVTVQRGGDTTHHTQYISNNIEHLPLSISEMSQMRAEIEQQLSEWIEPPSSTEAEQAWKKISSVTSSLAQNLSEQLRLVLEPTQTSRLKGDYRTGRRINMRKVIPYIASQFRKDKIWLRRTKPSKREYKIVLAIDDSSSMADNHSKELAFESVALISKALTLLESGQLSVLSFGECTQVLHKLSDAFTEKSGCNILQKFQFLQQKTCIGKLVDFATEMLNSAQTTSNALIAKLLIIVSDGRGIFFEGEKFVQRAVRRAQLSNIFTVFVIIDSPVSKDSILDIRMPVFVDGKLLGIKSYMDSFPFPFYIILRNINSLPNVLSDALRQWFEIVSNIDKH